MDYFLHQGYSDAEKKDFYGDRGPIYTEFHPDQMIVEPFNFASAIVFLLIVAYWFFKIRNRKSEFKFIWYAIPILAIGGIGGSIYHGTRTHNVWLYMDWLPIAILTMSTAIYFFAQLGYKWYRILAISIVIFSIVSGLIALIRFDYIAFPKVVAIGIGYTSMGAYILIPVFRMLHKNKYRHAKWVYLALGSFALAIISRGIDRIEEVVAIMPMGTHFLWHTFGALAAHLLMVYIYHYLDDKAKGRVENKQELATA